MSNVCKHGHPIAPYNILGSDCLDCYAEHRGLAVSPTQRTDYELARAFFSKLWEKGMTILERDYDGNNPPAPGSTARVFEFHNAQGEKVFCFHFLCGDFHRCSGFVNGTWAEELDGKKYYG